MIPVSRPSIGNEELNAIRDVFTSGWLGMGKWVFEFENRLKEYLGAKNVIAVNTGTSALHLALAALGVRERDEVIVPSLTFVATIQAIMSCGAKPVFCDIKSSTLNMDVDDVRNKITNRTKIILPVHYSGIPCEMDAILAIANKKNITVLEDAAHAFGSHYKGKKIGSFGHVTCFSFDPIKNITCAEGGAIATRDTKLAHLIYTKRILGISKDTWSRYRHKRDWLYKVTTEGFRYHMSNINAAIGIEQLKKLNKFIARKREISMRYDAAFRDIKNIELIHKNYKTIAPFNYIMKVKKGRNKLIYFLKGHGIETGLHYIPNHLQPFFTKFKVSLPVTEEIFKEIITLPLYYNMTEEDVMLVIRRVKDFFI